MFIAQKKSAVSVSSHRNVLYAEYVSHAPLLSIRVLYLTNVIYFYWFILR